MPTVGLPIPLVRGAMRLLPETTAKLVVGVMVRRMERRHPKLFSNLARLDPAIVHIEPTDLPWRFVLTLGPDPDMTLQEPDSCVLSSLPKKGVGSKKGTGFPKNAGRAKKADATVAGPLEALLDMLEGKSDGDTLFFDRGITVAGNTAVIVALRNTLDREALQLLDDVASFLGPFANPAKAAVQAVDRWADLLRQGRKDQRRQGQGAKGYDGSFS